MRLDLPRTTLVDSVVWSVLGSKKVITSFFTASLTREPLKPTRDTPIITVKRENHLWGGQWEGLRIKLWEETELI